MASKEGCMHRNERNSMQRLLSVIHSNREEECLSPQWRDSVMNEIARTGRFTANENELERLAPRFAMAAGALSLLMVFTASWTLKSLPGLIHSAYTSEFYSIVPTTMMNM